MIAVEPVRGRRSTGWFRARLGIATTTVALLAAAAFAVSLAAGPPPAEAQGLTTGFSEDNMFLSPDASTRAYWFGRAAADKAQIARVNIYWRKVVGSSPPANPTNPADPDYDFSRLDGAVRDAAARHLQVLITVFGAPTWAEGKNRPSSAPLGTWKPDPHALGQFAQALAKRYSGSFQGLPRVSLFEVWNEPNLSVNLTPQWVGKKPTSPDLYRSLLNAFYRGVKSVAPADTVIGGATAPFGDPRSHPRDPKLPRMRPLAFLRQMFCLNNNLGAACNATTHLDVLSHHPINIANPPTYRAINHDDIEVADFHKLVPLIHAAERTGHVLPAGPHPLWATELAWYTKPPSNVRDTACEAGQVARAGPLPALEAGRIGGGELPASRRPAHERVLRLIGGLLPQRQAEAVLHELSVPVRHPPDLEPASGRLGEGAGVGPARDPEACRQRLGDDKAHAGESRPGLHRTA